MTHKLVPIEPTPEMLERTAHNLSDEFGVEFVLANKEFALAVWNELISAAPKPSIPADDREEVARAINELFLERSGYTVEEIADAAISTLQRLGWKPGKEEG